MTTATTIAILNNVDHDDDYDHDQDDDNNNSNRRKTNDSSIKVDYKPIFKTSVYQLNRALCETQNLTAEKKRMCFCSQTDHPKNRLIKFVSQLPRPALSAT